MHVDGEGAVQPGVGLAMDPQGNFVVAWADRRIPANLSSLDTRTIQVLTGRLVVEVAGEAHPVAAGQVLALAPCIRHSVRAVEPGEMLLTVHFVGT